MSTTHRSPKTSDGAFAPTADIDAILRLSPSDFERRIARLVELAREAESLLPAATPLTPEERQTSIGKLRQGEPDAMTAILDTVDAFPGVFASLADKDRGVDDDRVETTAMRRSLACLRGFEPVTKSLARLNDAVSDLALRLGEAAREFTIPAYRIGQANAPTHEGLRAKLAPAIEFYGKLRGNRPSRQEPPENP